ncbi:hypothetical protein C8A05DRAFT_36347 [Staphylotrichum tortipilum]|uniref:Uncharacterized protein n=1 Tax=Staphylotrichum tortipilum TaxID=2831512 RepID=A0AAN6MFZ3_9PEZI|nr:hypothetical protein C8A05DRAFT_36347 [Staphylotrichum longicolle]
MNATSPVMLNDYEAKRKQQNREAQRRYSKFNSVSGFDDYLSNDFSYFGTDLSEPTFSPHSTTSYHGTPSALPSTSSGSGNGSWTTSTTVSTGHSPHLGIASNLCAKAEGLIDELERLYEFGVDMEIISPRGALADNLSETRGLFREVAHVGGKRKR